MGIPQLLDRKSLGRLGGPQLIAIRRGRDRPLAIHLLDRVRHGGSRNHRQPLLHRLRATGQQARAHQAARPVVDQHPLGPRRQGRQPAAHRFLAGLSAHNPLHRHGRIGRGQDGSNGGLIHRLAHHPNPVNGLAGQGCLQGPGQHRASSHLEQQLVALGAHAAATAGRSDQQMHKQPPPMGQTEWAPYNQAAVPMPPRCGLCS